MFWIYSRFVNSQNGGIRFGRLVALFLFGILVNMVISSSYGTGRSEQNSSGYIEIKDQESNPRHLSPEQIQNETKLEQEIARKVNALIKQMTLEEKVGQMTQITLDVIADKESLKTDDPSLDLAKLKEAIFKYHVGSILNVAGDKAHSLELWHKILSDIQDVALQDRLKIPVLYGVDSIHGAHYTKGATIFPQSIAMAATWNPGLSEKAGEITALETKISGIPWNFFPVLDVGRQVLWPRFYETYGEDVLLAKRMGWANIMGQQGQSKNDLAKNTRVGSCMKHYVGYSFPWSGKDRTPSIITEKMMHEYFLPTFRAAVQAGSETVMVNSGEVDGIPGHANHHLLTEILKGEMKFKGFAVSDWEDIKRLYTRDHMASSPEQAVQIAVMAGVDMSMVPFDYSFADYLVKLVKSNKVPMSRINDAVARILRVKFLLGVFENPYPSRELQAQFGTEESAQISQAMAGEGITLLKNDQNLLPLSKQARILVTGPAANSLSALNGGWTITWQGGKEELYPKNKLTIVAALRKEMTSQQVDYFKGVEFHQKAADYESALQAARNSDLIVLCLGEKTYTETPGNIDDLTLDSAQIEFAKEIYKQGKPVVLVMVEGRPRVIREIEPGAGAIVMAYLPGMEGAPALAKILTGSLNPSGKLPYSYPRYVNSTIPYDHKYQEEADGNTYNPQWPFGFGLSYTKFAYSDLQLSSPQFDPKSGLTARVKVTNEGDWAGQEVVQLYLSDVYRKDSTPPVKQLIDFRKIRLAPKESKVIEFNVQLNQLSYVASNYKRIVERGDFKLQIEKLVVPFTF